MLPPMTRQSTRPSGSTTGKIRTLKRIAISSLLGGSVGLLALVQLDAYFITGVN